MRRVTSVILLVIGGWLLTAEAVFAGINLGAGPLVQFFMLLPLLVLAVLALGVGTLVSPGNRPADLGLTLMIVAGVTAFSGVTILLAYNDPAVAKMMPPDQPLPDLAINPIYGGINLLMITGLGYLLWRRGRIRVKAKAAELERVFGD